MFDDVSSERIVKTGWTGAVIAPLTFGAWANPDADITTQTIISIADTAGNNDYWSIDLISTNSLMRFDVRDSVGTINSNHNTDSYAVNTWGHFAAVEENGTTRRLYADGVKVTGSTTDRTPDGADHLAIGALIRSAKQRHFSGRIFWPFVYDTNLTDAEILRLANGAPPNSIKPGNLVFWGHTIGDNFLDISPGAANVMVPENTPVMSPDIPPKVNFPGPRARSRARAR